MGRVGLHKVLDGALPPILIQKELLKESSTLFLKEKQKMEK
jgi:hypothetical protein